MGGFVEQQAVVVVAEIRTGSQIAGRNRIEGHEIAVDPQAHRLRLTEKAGPTVVRDQNVVGRSLDEGGTLAWPRAGSLRRMIGQHIEQVLNGVDEIHVHEGERGLLITDLLISGAQGRRPVGGERQRRRLVPGCAVLDADQAVQQPLHPLAGLRILGPVDVIKSVLKIQRQRLLRQRQFRWRRWNLLGIAVLGVGQIGVVPGIVAGRDDLWPLQLALDETGFVFGLVDVGVVRHDADVDDVVDGLDHALGIGIELVTSEFVTGLGDGCAEARRFGRALRQIAG